MAELGHGGLKQPPHRRRVSPLRTTHSLRWFPRPRRVGRHPLAVAVSGDDDSGDAAPVYVVDTTTAVLQVCVCV